MLANLSLHKMNYSDKLTEQHKIKKICFQNSAKRAANEIVHTFDQSMTSKLFIREMKKAVLLLNTKTRNFIHKYSKINLSRKFSDISPALASNKPRGYQEGKTGNDMAACVLGKNISFFENSYYKQRGIKGKDITKKYANIKQDLPHEVGHVVNKNIFAAFKGGFASDSEDFIRAHQDDLINIPEKAKVKLQYFIQNSQGNSDFSGRDECFAEAFNILSGGGTLSKEERKLFERYFKNSIAHVKKLMVLYGFIKI